MSSSPGGRGWGGCLSRDSLALRLQRHQKATNITRPNNRQRGVSATRNKEAKLAALSSPSLLSRFLSQEEIIGAASRPVGSSSSKFSHKHERPLGGPSTGARRKGAPTTPPAFPEKPPAADHQPSPGPNTKRTSSHSSASPVHSGKDPSRPRLLELPCRSSPTFFCSSLLLLPPRWIQSEEPAWSAGPEVLYL